MADGGGPAAPRLYGELASWWPLLSRPEDYAEEAAFFRRTLAGACRDGPPATLLELGSGGGNTASHLKRHLRVTLTDLSPDMLAVSRALNPGCEHALGDMRHLRLGRTFDLVLAHDAVSYLTTIDDLGRAAETAFVHLRPGGAALFAPDHLEETFRPSTSHGGHDAGDRGLRYLAWTRGPHPGEGLVTVDYAYLLREGDAVLVEHDRHVEGLFRRDRWITALEGAGFQVEVRPFEHSEVEPGAMEVFVCVRPAATP